MRKLAIVLALAITVISCKKEMPKSPGVGTATTIPSKVDESSYESLVAP